MSKLQKTSRPMVEGQAGGGELEIPGGYLPHVIRHCPTNCKLRTYPDLSAFALRERLDLPLRLWYLLRQGCPDGQGWILQDEVFKFSCGNKR